ncbi:hypothetical protein CN568_14670 [Bacillus pseudomycoides]|nr:hypothetical protein [Bacillus pseudomycoides]PDZ75165.1 hypothetical protein CON58_00120 [Bacillus pseudomycoides]PEP40459.1 hypothetical protein CN565_18260 [Bacillus pseudomycoides]PEP43140.1 hypothetical protein CN568_14670 [Bacillus pseudomycoides]PFX48700.1 hypothetical protein COL31_21690 [Bacillus pseudomycoides]
MAVYLILKITNKKKLEFTYCYIRYRKFTASWIVRNALIEIVVGRPFENLVGFGCSFGQLVTELEK